MDITAGDANQQIINSRLVGVEEVAYGPIKTMREVVQVQVS